MRRHNRVTRLSSVFLAMKRIGILEEVYYPTLIQWWKIIKQRKTPGKAIKKYETIDNNINYWRYISISGWFGCFVKVGSLDNIDHLSNRRIQTVGDLLKLSFSVINFV